MMYFTHAYGEINLPYSLDPDCVIDLHNDLHHSQWARRGWTFQEHAMAKAHIVFGTSGVYFGRDGEYVTTNDGKGGHIPQASITALQTNQELHRAWENIMLHYSARKTSSFTSIKDLLPALSGLAKQFGNKLQFKNKLRVKYIAGHWLDRLHYTLLWQNDALTEASSLDDIKSHYEQEEYLIPTWSCLTRNTGELHFYNSEYDYRHGQYHEFRPEFEILSAFAPLVGGDPYGAIKTASLTLEGFILDLNAMSWSEEPRRLVGSVDSQTEIWFGMSDGDSWQRTDEFYVFDRTGEPEHDGAHIDWHESGNIQPLPPAHSDLGYIAISRDYTSCFGGGSTFGRSPYSDDHHGRVHQRDTVYSYRIVREFQSKQDYFAEPGKMRASFDELISRVALLLVASDEKPEEDSDGYGLLLIRLDGAPKNSFLRVGMFSPQVYRGGLACLKRLMKKETINLF